MSNSNTRVHGQWTQPHLASGSSLFCDFPFVSLALPSLYIFLVPVHLPDVLTLEGPGFGPSTLFCPYSHPDDLIQVHRFKVHLSMLTAPKVVSLVLAVPWTPGLSTQLPTLGLDLHVMDVAMTDKDNILSETKTSFHPQTCSFHSLLQISKWLHGTFLLPVLRPQPI